MKQTYGQYIHHISVVFIAGNGDRISSYALCDAPFPQGKAHTIADFTNGELTRFIQTPAVAEVAKEWLQDLEKEEQAFRRTKEESDADQESDPGDPES